MNPTGPTPPLRLANPPSPSSVLRLSWRGGWATFSLTLRPVQTTGICKLARPGWGPEDSRLESSFLLLKEQSKPSWKQPAPRAPALGEVILLLSGQRRTTSCSRLGPGKGQPPICHTGKKTLWGFPGNDFSLPLTIYCDLEDHGPPLRASFTPNPAPQNFLSSLGQMPRPDTPRPTVLPRLSSDVQPQRAPASLLAAPGRSLTWGWREVLRVHRAGPASCSCPSQYPWQEANCQRSEGKGHHPRMAGVFQVCEVNSEPAETPRN